MKELDALLVRYLDARYRQAAEAERAAFERLLACEDDRIWKWFLGREPAPDAELQGIVERILGSN
ncbi:MAG TPA: succinate dehydrogenase assembly factor 2 [Xanthomonadaceae bacterium]|nr:succinate dehydrogenase assembly factor 2 [Xanthomonadaceae bacterium]